ncbi:MAG TPA: hypothetical protein VG014_14655 [Acidimicrobiales bacterium]|nr:hypothetical protein [Acidimicrobiales bacterium]
MHPDPATTRPLLQASGDRIPGSSPESGVDTTRGRSSWMTVLAFAVLAIPFAIILIRFLAASGQHIYLPDDLALIDLHTREALRWRQQLGVFDHNNWNHPGPSYFYLLSLAYRVLGSGARAEFFGATLLNALAALACVGVVRRRTTPARALWAAVWIGLLAGLLAITGPGSMTYSEGGLGALVSPWNPMVVILPLVLFTVLCAAALDRSALSLVGALLVGSFIVQTDISTLPVVAAVLAVAGVGWLVTLVIDRRRSPAPQHLRPRWWVTGGLVVFAAMWTPPIIQQFTNHPGNFTLIYRFFTSGQPGQSFHAALWSVAAVNGILVEGPSEVMSSLLGVPPSHSTITVVVWIAVLLVGAAVTAVGIRQRLRLATGLGALSLVGGGATVLAVTHVIGLVFGYLVAWEIAMPIAALIGLGLVRWPWPTTGKPSRPPTASAGLRLGLGGVAVLVGVVLAVRVISLPALSTVSDPTVARLDSLVTPSLSHQQAVFVGDNGVQPLLLGVEQFIGLVNQLDEQGYHPKVNTAWKAQFGTAYLATGHEASSIELSPWSARSTGLPGYAGRVGNIAVTITRPPGGQG